MKRFKEFHSNKLVWQDSIKNFKNSMIFAMELKKSKKKLYLINKKIIKQNLSVQKATADCRVF